MNKRLDELDSLRGLAAFSVLASHLMLVFPIIWDIQTPANAPWWLKLAAFSPLHMLWAGHEAVIFFFVLSGFVLSLPFLERDKTVPYGLYLVKRILRIYSPYIVAAVSAILLRELCYNGAIPGVSYWFNQSWKNPATWSVLRDHLILIGSFANCDFDPVLWSLVHEMRISIVFPIIIYLVRFWEKTSIAIAFALSCFCGLTISLKFRGVIAYEHDYFATLHYVGMFIAGGLLAKYRRAIVSRISRLQRNTKLLFLLVGVFAYSNAFWLPFYGHFNIKIAETLFHKPIIQEWITTLGVSIFLAISLGTHSASSLLSSAFPRFLGKISYSLYLFHAICLKVLIVTLYAYVPIWGILVLFLGASFAVATLSHYLLEAPSINLAKLLTKRFYIPKKTPAAPITSESLI